MGKVPAMKVLKPILFTLVMLAFFGVFLEGAGRIMLRKVNGEWISGKALVAKLAGDHETQGDEDLTDALDQRKQLRSYMQQHILHPYLGFVRNPDMPEHQFIDRPVPLPVNDYGFFGDSPMVKPSDDTFNVYVVGGSLALDFYLDAHAYLADKLGSLPAAQGKVVKPICLSLGGMKQPQQLLLLNYLFSIGAEPDLVIVLDGFNEVVLPMIENLPGGVNPYFPRKWQVYGASSVDMEFAAHVGDIASRREAVEDSLAAMAQSPARKSSLAVALWQRAHQGKVLARTQSEQALQALMQKRGEEPNRQLSGPDITAQGKEAQIRECAEVWYRCSMQTWALCQSKGVAYAHFLQPNQYVADSKPLSAWEKENAIGPPGYLWRIAATHGYPLLVGQGEALAAAGVPFVDLTDAYQDVTETIYKDNCCHINDEGNRILADRIADALAVSQ